MTAPPRSDSMEQLVDAFRGLATEGNKGSYLADVEAIVNNYFNKHQQPATPDLPTSPVPHRLDTTQQPGEVANMSSFGPDLLAESPIRETGRGASTPPRGGHGEVSVGSSGGSLKGWGGPHNAHNDTLAEAQLLQAMVPDVSGSDFYARSTGWQARQLEQRARQKHVMEEKETEGCTWRPQINRYSPRRNHSRVEDRLHASQAARQERLRHERDRIEAQRASGCTFRPKVNPVPTPSECNSSASVATAPVQKDPFQRLYETAGQKKRRQQQAGDEGRQHRSRSKPGRSGSQQQPPGTTPVLYTTFDPSKPKKGSRGAGGKTQVSMNLSVEEIEATERELEQIEELLNRRLRGGASRDQDADNIPFPYATLVTSNYTDSDGEEEEEMVAAAVEEEEEEGEDDTVCRPRRRLVDFNTFLLRQNAFEERRRSNLAFLEADTAPALHPTIAPRSKKIAAISGNNTTTASAGGSAEHQQQKEVRLKKLATECRELRAEVFRLLDECEAQLKKLAVVSKLPECRSRATGVAQLRTEVQELRQAMPSPTTEFLRQHVVSGRGSEALQQKIERGRDRVGSWVKELLEVRGGLAETRVKAAKLKDTLAVEHQASVDLCHGCIPWETVVKMKYTRSSSAGAGGRGTEQGTRPDPEPTGAVQGDLVMARREEWQAFEKGRMVSLSPGGSRCEVQLDTASKPQTFPATSRHVVLQPSTGFSFAPKLKQQYLQTCVKTKEDVTVHINGVRHVGKVLSGSGDSWSVLVGKAGEGPVKLSKRATVPAGAIKCSKEASVGEHYNPKSLEGYMQQLEDGRKRKEEKREKTLLERQLLDASECTHTPHINSAPEYITRIANSMQLLRGEV